jgi:hypothetical protein
MPVINGVYLKDFAALPSAVVDANIIPIAISGNQIAYRTTVGGIVTDARVTSKLLTGLSVTGGAVVATDTILQAFGKVQNQINSKVSSVGLTMPSAFSVANSPITSAGTLAVTAIGAASQYIRGDGALADFPTSGGGGSSVAYYLNGSISQGTFVGNTYYEMNKTPVIGTGTDFTINANGYIAQFITDANDPASLLIPAGNWNVEMYFSASSNGGNPSFYVEVYKYNGTTFTLLGSSATTPEGITNGTAIDIYYTSVGIPETVLTITDRLAIRVYVTHSGRTITLHTEDNHLSEIVTTFSNGLTALNGLTKQAQYFAVGSTGTDFNIASSVDTHTFNIPDASASNRGFITTGAQTIAGDKTFTSASANPTVIIKNTGSGRKFEVHNSGGSSVFYVDLLGATYITDNLSISSGTFNMGQTMLATGASYFASNLNVTRLSSANSYTIAFRTGAIQTTATPNWYIGNYSGNADFEISKYDGSSVVNTLKINTTTNLVTLLGGISATTANFTGQLTLGSTISNGTYTYTLPGATGTLALTSALSGYVDLTTDQTIAGFKTFSTTIKLTNGTSNGFSFESGTTGNYLSLKAPAGLGAGIIVTLPSATGTLALTSDIHSAVTLSAIGSTPNANGATLTGQVLNLQPADASFGGVVTTGTQTFAGAKTLTGALSGTSATFSGTVTVSNADTLTYLQLANTSAGGQIYTLISAGVSNPHSEAVGTFYIRNSSTNTTPFRIASTGAATFSSSVTATSGLYNGYTSGLPPTSGSAVRGGLRLNNASNIALDFGTVAAGQAWIQVSDAGSYASNFPLLLNPNGGNVLIGTTTDATGKLQVNGTIYATGFFESSSIKGKDIIKTNPLTNLNLDVIQYTRKTDENKDVRYGYSAEQIHSLMPELTDKNVTAVKYLDVHTLLIAQLQQEIKELKAKLN